MNGKRAFEILQKIGFERMSGTKEEEKAAKIICDEIEKIGGKPEIEEFEVNSQTIHKAKLEVLEPEYKEYKVIGYGNAGSTKEEGLVADFYYMTTDSIIDKELAKGKIVLINGRLTMNVYKRIVEAGAVGFISFCGELKDAYDDIDLAYPELRQPLKDIKVLPGVSMNVHDAVDLVLSEPKKVKLTLVQDEYKILSHNVISKIEAKNKTDETIILTSHYDSVRYSTGVYDNGAGSVINLEAYRYFLENKPNRNLIFIWCGSEERGLLGSKAYVKKHEEELKNVKIVINCDVAGPVLGADEIFVTANEEILSYCKALGSELAFPANYHLDIYSSDGVPFTDKGIPSISVTRFGTSGTAYIHNHHDIIKYLDYKNLEKTGNYLIQLVNKIDKSQFMPFSLNVCDQIKEKVDKYLFKK